MSFCYKFILITLSIFGIFITKNGLDNYNPHISPDNSKDQRRELLYLPTQDAVNFLSFGYRNAMADLLWFVTINYFGKHYKSDKNYEWLYHMTDCITSLDPKARHVYEFGSTMLSWEQKQPQEAILILSKAIKSFPEDWYYYYLRGFAYMYFLKDADSAKIDFVTASKLPGVNPTVVRLAGEKLMQTEDPASAIQFLEMQLRTNKDPSFQHSIRDKILNLKYEVDIKNLNFAREIYESKYNKKLQSIDDLVNSSVIKSLPKDPWGGTYSFNIEKNAFVTTTRRKSNE